MGTPILTPPLTKRKRQQMMEEAETNPIYLSQYDGLEKETECFLPPKPPSNNQDVQIHEGKNSEKQLLKKYELFEVLGVGSTSTCHRCRARSTGAELACKIIDKSTVSDRFQGMMDQFKTEIQALKQLRRHPNIIRLYDVYISDEKLWIVMELMEGGELFDYVVQRGTLTEEEASACVRMVTSALVYMHSKNIIHRDLKPENLLLKYKPNPTRNLESLEVKIIDFGLSKCLAPADVAASSFLGTRGYLAPEMLQRNNYSKQVDTWALGVIVFVLLCGCLPFDDDSSQIPPDVLNLKFQLRFPRWAKNLSDSAKDLLEKLLDINPATRYTAEQALRHPWVTGAAAPKESLLESPGRIKRSPRIPPKVPSRHRRQRSKDYNYMSPTSSGHGVVSASVQRTLLPPRALVRKTSI